MILDGLTNAATFKTERPLPDRRFGEVEVRVLHNYHDHDGDKMIGYISKYQHEPRSAKARKIKKRYMNVSYADFKKPQRILNKMRRERRAVVQSILDNPSPPKPLTDLAAIRAWGREPS